jgi:hypothetical protein
LAGWLAELPPRSGHPDPTALGPDQAHWLVTDGADPRLRAWAAHAPLARVIGVGEATENAAVSLLSVRRSPVDPRHYQGLVAVTNAGRRPTARFLTVASDVEQIADWQLELDPEQTLTREFAWSGEAPGTVTAELTAGDALRADDRLRVATAGLADVPVQVDPGCGQHLRAALAANPFISAEGGAAALRVACGPEAGTASDGPAIWVRAAGTPLPVAEDPAWTQAAGDLRNVALDRAWLYAFRAAGDAAGSARAWLVAGDAPLILFHPRRHILEVRLDTEHPALVSQPAYPLLVNLLVESLSGRAPPDNPAHAERTPDEVRIAPSRITPAAHADTARVPPGGLALADYLLPALCLLLLYDALRLAMVRGRTGPAERGAGTRRTAPSP